MEIIEANPDKPWNWDVFSCNPNITMEIIKANPDNPWDWWMLSHNPNVTMEIIEANPDKPWDWHGISYNSNLTMEFINAKPNKQWAWNWITCNRTITMEFISKNPDKPWNRVLISKHKFTKSKTEFIVQKYRQYLAAYKIQQWWHRLRLDPRHPVGQRRLEQEYTALFGPEAL